MKKILSILLFFTASLLYGQKISELPTTTTGATGDFLIKNDANGASGATKKITVGNFITTYGLGSVTSVASGYGLTGGTITATGTLKLDTTSGTSGGSRPATQYYVGSRGFLSGSGTQNFIPKWNNAGGTTLGNSNLSDDGTNIIIANGKKITGANTSLFNMDFGSSGNSFTMNLGTALAPELRMFSTNITMFHGLGSYVEVAPSYVELKNNTALNLLGNIINIADAASDSTIVIGKIRFNNGTQGNGKVWTSNANGVGSWQTPAGGSLTVGTTTVSSGTNGNILYNNSGVLGEKTPTGTGDVVLASAPTLTNPVVGTQSANDNSTKAASTAYVDGAIKSEGDLTYTGQWHTFMHIGRTTAGGWNGTIWYMPYFVGTRRTVTDIGVEVTTAVASENIRLAIYNDNSGVPGTLIEESGNVSAATTGFKSFTFTSVRTLQEGKLYWLAMQASVSGINLRYAGASSVPTIIGPNTGSSSNVRTESQAYGAFPATANTSAWSSAGNSALIFVKIQ